MLFLTTDYKLVNELKQGAFIKGHNDDYEIVSTSDKNINIKRVHSYDKSIKVTIPIYLDIASLIKVSMIKNTRYYYINIKGTDIMGLTIESAIDTLKNYLQLSK